MTDSLQLGLDALDATASTADHRSLIERLIPLAQGLARVRPDGVTVGDVRREAVRHGILPAKAKGRELAFLGAVMQKAGLVSTEEFRRSDVDASHGNLHRVWKRPS
jgi:hypothetical protein